MSSCGIYMWTNLINGHRYIGMSKNIERRWREHSRLPFSSGKSRMENNAFYNAIRKYGPDNFRKEILEECKEEDLKDREKYYIKKYRTFENSSDYNETPGGDCAGPSSILSGERHGMHKITLEEVIFCREQYRLGAFSMAVWNQYFVGRITYNGFLRMWHGKTWKNVLPEVFENNPHKAKYSAQDRDNIVKLFNESGLNRHQFALSEQCFVGETTLYNMLDNPTFYDNK